MAIVGRDHLITDDSALKRYGRATYAVEHPVLAAVQPGNTEQVQQCLRLAQEQQVPVYPISTGLNTGYGSAVPCAPDCLLLDLSRMRAISDYDAELACVWVEPGVTQQQLYDFLQEQGDGLWMDCTGSYPEHSLIGNIMERGFGHTFMADHYAQVGGFEVVLPTGDCIETGAGQFAGARARGYYRWGVGPHIDGLFTQGNFGVVTRACIWLHPAPPYTLNFACAVNRDDDLEALVDCLRPLRLDGTIPSAMHIGNDYKVLTSILRYPHDRAGGKGPLPEALRDEMIANWEFGAWNVSGALYGTRASVRESKQRLKAALKPLKGRVRFVDEGLLRFAQRISRPYAALTGKNLEEMLKLARPVFGMTQGRPSRDVIASTYWRKREAAPADPNPERDRCGLIWVSPVFPTRGAEARAVWDTVRETLLEFGFEPSVSITMITGRASDCVVSIAYDRDQAGEDEAALACRDALLTRLAGQGYYPYRLGAGGMGLLANQRDSNRRLLADLKRSLDPAGILAPGRYEPGE